MLRIPLSIMMAAQFAISDIEFFDSKTNPNITYVLYQDCAVPVSKSMVKDYCYVEKKVNRFCKLNIRLDKCDGQE